MTDELPEGLSREQADALRSAAKEELRRRVAALRRALPPHTRRAHALAMAERLTQHPLFRDAEVVLAYAALRFELDVWPVVEAALSLGKTVVLPRTIAETRAIVLHVYRTGDALLESGFVVKEPLETAPQLAAEEVQLVLVPGLAFDARGHRLGYGQGYYDRLLPQLPKATRVGVAYELSLLVEVPSLAHDVPVDYLATERRLFACDRA